MRRGTLPPLASLISIPSSCDHARVLENSRRRNRGRISLSLSRRRAQSESIDRSIHLEYRTNRNIGKGSGWMENWLSESWTDFPLCIYSLFLSPLAGFSLRFNDRLTESLCLSPLSLSVPRFHVLSLLAQFGKSDISIELVHSPSYLEMERGWGRGKAVSSREKDRAIRFPFFPPLLYLPDLFLPSRVSPLLVPLSSFSTSRANR